MAQRRYDSLNETLRGVFLRLALAVSFLSLAFACGSNRCLDMCQAYEVYLEDCGYGWSTAFAEQGWTTLDDCYDTYWEATEQQQETCADVVETSADLTCF